MAYGNPVLELDTKDGLVFSDMGLNRRKDKKITVSNKAPSGILNVHISTPNNAPWLTVSPHYLAQTSSNRNVTVTVSTIERFFEKNQSASSHIIFKYQTDRGEVVKKEKVVVSVGAQNKDPLRHSVYVLIFFYYLSGLYVIASLIRDNEIFPTFFIGLTCLLSATILTKVHKYDKVKDIFDDDEIFWGIASLYFMYSYAPELLIIILLIAICVYFMKSVVNDKPVIFTRLAPVLAVIIYIFIIASAPSLKAKYSLKRFAEIFPYAPSILTDSVKETRTFVTFSIKCNVRETPDPKGIWIGETIIGNSYMVLDTAERKNWYQIDFDSTKAAYVHITSSKGEFFQEEVIISD